MLKNELRSDRIEAVLRRYAKDPTKFNRYRAWKAAWTRACEAEIREFVGIVESVRAEVDFSA
jgi:hypothetical protein